MLLYRYMETEQLTHKRHTLAHLLASAVLVKYPKAKLTLGPAISNGFYYDIDFTDGEKPSTDADFKGLTTDIKKLIQKSLTFSHKTVSLDEALLFYANNEYKQELIREIAERGESITLYTVGDFTDLCRGGHCDNINEIDKESFKITHSAGAYWRGDEKRPMLTRIYGLAFENKEELDAYIETQEEAKKRDHRLIGKQLGLFIFSDLVGPGLPLWTPKGTFLRNSVNNYVQELRATYNYGQVTIPHLTKSDLYKTSGHWEKYAEDLYKVETRDGHILCMKPMNCPHHAQIYASELRSYRELPIRYSETTMVYRDEQSGELSGLSRVLSITQDDAHIFCRENQLEEEINGVWNLIETFYSTFGFGTITPRFSSRDDDAKFKGNSENWDKAEGIILDLLNKRAPGKWLPGEGEAAFYGPKIDFMAMDALGRKHQVGTIQLDYVQPTNFGLEYVAEDGSRQMPVMIHCAIAGSLERFLSVYIEHCAGNFPLWMAPTQVQVLPISDMHVTYAEQVQATLANAGMRSELVYGKDGFGKRVRAAKDAKVPYFIVIGDKDIEADMVTLESRDNGPLGQFTFEQIVSTLKEEIINKK
jgi:threonyl-tRNA synthetase